MTKTKIKGEVQEELAPLAPFIDEANNQYLVDALSGHMFSPPQIEVPEKILLGSLRDGRLRVLSAIKVRLSVEGDHMIAEAFELDEFGFGANFTEAIADLQRTIAELYFTLEKEQERLGVDMQRVWNILQKKILKR
jgi:hypothetical protein